MSHMSQSADQAPAEADGSRHDSPVHVVHETDTRFGIGKSTIPGAGNGVFAQVALVAGDELEVVGVLVLADSVSDRCSHYADQHKVRVGDYLLIPLGYGGIINHSSDPNMEKVIDANRVFLRALRPIDVGEELLWQYSAYAQERFGFH